MRLLYSRVLILFAGLTPAGIWPTGLSTVAVAEEIQPYYLMDREPAERPLPTRWSLHPELLPLWKKAFAHPESELRRQAAEAVVTGHLRRHDGMGGFVPELLNLLTDEKAHPAARHAAAHALIVLDHRDSASTLMEVSQKQGKDLRLLVEPAFARWEYEAIRPVWHQRIASVTTPRSDLILAINGLARQRDSTALNALLALALATENPADIRLASARAAGQVVDQGLEPQAEQLLARGRDRVLERLCGVSLIARHRSEPAVAIHQTLGRDPEPAVAAEALRSLSAIDSKLVLPLAESALQNPDANVRRIGIETYLALPTPERLQTLSQRLSDPHPKLRGLVRDTFFELAKDAVLEPAIRQSAIAILAGDDWRGQEQAALLLGALDEESATTRLLELLNAKRPEVMVASAWSLKSIAVGETVDPVIAFAQRRTDNPHAENATEDAQLAHLFELLGRLKTAQAMPLMEQYIPKNPKFGPASRTAAVWALGVIQEGQPNEAQAKQLMERAMDIMTSPPEFFSVRRAAVLTLGRLRAKSQLAGLKQLIGPTVDNDLLELTVRWSVLQISGEVLPIMPPVTIERTGWFLEPSLRKREER
jgi:HEAT repeat protein